MNIRILSPASCRLRQRLRWLVFSTAVTLGLAHPFSASGLTMASASLDLTALSITPASGTLVWTGPWSLSAFVLANNSSGGLVFDFQTDSVSTSATAGVTHANGNASASYPAVGGLFGHVDSTLTLPGGFEAAASVFPAVSTLANSFSITGTSGPVAVTFNALLLSSLVSVGGVRGQVLQNDTIFNLNVDGAPVLFFFDQLIVGEGASGASLLSPALSVTLVLEADTLYNLDVSIEVDPSITTTPESGATWFLLLLGGSAVAALRQRLKLAEPGKE